MEDFSKYNAEGSMLRNAQMRMLDILIEVDKICRKNNIDYWLDAGTLLGAVRHKGFIPWDDDIDICVKREDYKRLKKCMIAELPSKFVFTDTKTDSNYFCNYARVKDINSNINYPPFSYQKHQGIFIDIFIVEKSIPVLKKIVDPIYGPIFRQVHNFGKYLYKSNTKRLFNKSVSMIMYPFAELLVISSRLIAKVFNSKTYTFPYSSMTYHRREEKDIYPLIEILFEGYYFKVPNNCDAYLKNLFGDYMKIPEESGRIQFFTNIEIYDL
ncbi:MAG: LicD family protein [bacterium]